MSNLAPAFESTEAYLERGEVLAADAGRWVVAVGARSVHAARAASCLVEPSVGDGVLVATAGGQAYVLAVLERSPTAPVRIELDQGVELRSRSGAVAIRAATGVELTSGEAATVTARRLELRAHEGNVLIRALSLLGDTLEARVAHASLLAQTVETVAERLRQQLDRCYRFVKGLEQLRAGTLDYKAAGFARLHAEDTVVTADVLVKVDGKQIHVG